jgi:hypothetical protein
VTRPDSEASAPMSTPRAHRRTACGALAVAILLLAGCGSDDAPETGPDGPEVSSQSTAGEPADVAGLEAAARETAELLIEPDYGAAYGRLSDRCQEAVPVEEFIAQATEGADLALRMGVDLTAAVVTEVTTEDVTATRGRANVVVEVDGKSDEMGIAPFVYEGGMWRLDDCGAPESP